MKMRVASGESRTHKTLNIKLYIIIHIKSSHPNFEAIVNVNRLLVVDNYMYMYTSLQ